MSKDDKGVFVVVGKAQDSSSSEGEEWAPAEEEWAEWEEWAPAERVAGGERRTSSGRAVRPPDRLQQERGGRGQVHPRQREARLKETLAKSARLTQRLMRRLDRGSDESGEEDEVNLSSRLRRRRDQSDDSSDEEGGPRGDGKRKKGGGSDGKKRRRVDSESSLPELERVGRVWEGREVPEEQPALVTGGIMKPFQLEGLRWVASLRRLGANGILADEMGLGKTLQTISLFCHLYETEREAGPFLVVAPLSTIANWEREVRRFAPSVPCTLLYPAKVAARMWGELGEPVECAALGRAVGQVFITTYDTAIGVRAVLQEVAWSYVVVDEGHRIKNKKCRLATVLASLSSDNRLLLTGTPLQNNLNELWTLLNFLQPEIFNDHEIFETWFNAKTLHEDADEKARLVAQEEKSNVLASIHKTIAPFLLRRIKAEVELSIPPKVEVVVYCPLTMAQAKQYLMYRDMLVSAKQRAAKRGEGLGHYSMQYMIDLRSAINHPHILDPPRAGASAEAMVEVCGKLQVLHQLLPRLMAAGHKTLIFSQMTRMLDILAAYLAVSGIAYCSLDGRMAYQDRQENIERFTDEPAVMVFLLSTRAGGLGINLVAADTCVLYDSDWNPQADLQAQDRCHRIGQVRPVMVYRLVTRDTIDQVMVERAQAKRTLERLVVHKDKFKSGAKNLKSTAKGLGTKELVEIMMSQEAATTSSTTSQQWGLAEEELEHLLDRTKALVLKEEAAKEGKVEKVKGKSSVFEDGDFFDVKSDPQKNVVKKKNRGLGELPEDIAKEVRKGNGKKTVKQQVPVKEVKPKIKKEMDKIASKKVVNKVKAREFTEYFTVTEEAGFQCTKCDKRCQLIANMKQHIQHKHMGGGETFLQVK